MRKIQRAMALKYRDEIGMVPGGKWRAGNGGELAAGKRVSGDICRAVIAGIEKLVRRIDRHGIDVGPRGSGSDW